MNNTAYADYGSGTATAAADPVSCPVFLVPEQLPAACQDSVRQVQEEACQERSCLKWAECLWNRVRPFPS